MRTGKVPLTDLIWSAVRSHFAYRQNGLEGGRDAGRVIESYKSLLGRLSAHILLICKMG